MKKVNIDMEELIYAFQKCTIEGEYFLDAENGEMIYVSEVDDTKKKEAALEKMNSDPERYVLLPTDSSRKGYNDMLDFIATVKDEDLKEKLYVALDGRGAFRRFKNILLNHHEERDEWFRFQEKRTRERINEWLEANEIEPAE
ncbi:MAG: hypothetical protein KAS86_04035 [Candidatus Omnitrophica bacterium]|nr:hypothetical protein [Candidatus Omnitrophota bacterium]